MTEGIPGRILVVDDDQSMRIICSEVLAVCGYRVETARGCTMALKLLKEQDFDLVITDLNMPGLDGIAFYKRAVWHYPHLKDSFLFMTGDIAGDKFSAVMRLNKECLIKPFKTSLLSFTVRSMLEKIKRGEWDGRKTTQKNFFTNGQGL